MVLGWFGRKFHSMSQSERVLREKDSLRLKALGGLIAREHAHSLSLVATCSYIIRMYAAHDALRRTGTSAKSTPMGDLSSMDLSGETAALAASPKLCDGPLWCGDRPVNHEDVAAWTWLHVWFRLWMWYRIRTRSVTMITKAKKVTAI